jgi:NhaP-type Na+/H+ or K+/H+ antiporter
MDGLVIKLAALVGLTIVVVVVAAFVVGVVVQWAAEWKHQRTKARRIATERRSRAEQMT